MCLLYKYFNPFVQFVGGAIRLVGVIINYSIPRFCSHPTLVPCPKELSILTLFYIYILGIYCGVWGTTTFNRLFIACKSGSGWSSVMLKKHVKHNIKQFLLNSKHVSIANDKNGCFIII